MNRLYFAKFLPVSGEIKEGDWMIHPVNHPEPIQFDKMPKSTSGIAYSNNGWKRAKLFLCSRDIQVGDTYYNPTESLELTNECDSEIRLEQIQEQEKLFKHDRFKIIGEISSEAIWVKDGDEFDEEEWEKEEGFFETIRIKIKGPCGHFH